MRSEVSGEPYRWLRVRPRGAPASLAALDVYLGELVPPRGHVSAADGAKASPSAPAAGLVAMFSAASHAPAPAALPSRRAAGAGAPPRRLAGLAHAHSQGCLHNRCRPSRHAVLRVRRRAPGCADRLR